MVVHSSNGLLIHMQKDFYIYIYCQYRFVTTLLGNPKGSVELGSSNSCAAVRLCLFLFMPAPKIVCRETEVLNTVSFG